MSASKKGRRGCKKLSRYKFALNLQISHFPESVLVPILPKSKSIIPSFHTPFWDKAVDTIDSENCYEIWKLDGEEFLKNVHTDIILVGYTREISGGFLRIPRKVDWAAFRGPIRPPPEPPPKIIFSFHFFFFMHTCIHSYIEDNA